MFVSNIKKYNEIYPDVNNIVDQIIGLVPLNGESLSGSAPEGIMFACGSPN